MNGCWASTTRHPGPGWSRDGDAWRWAGTGADTVSLAATAEDDDLDNLAPEQRERLADSPEWARFVEREVADILTRHPGLT